MSIRVGVADRCDACAGRAARFAELRQPVNAQRSRDLRARYGAAGRASVSRAEALHDCDSRWRWRSFVPWLRGLAAERRQEVTRARVTRAGSDGSALLQSSPRWMALPLRNLTCGAGAWRGHPGGWPARCRMDRGAGCADRQEPRLQLASPQLNSLQRPCTACVPGIAQEQHRLTRVQGVKSRSGGMPVGASTGVGSRQGAICPQRYRAVLGLHPSASRSRSRLSQPPITAAAAHAPLSINTHRCHSKPSLNTSLLWPK